MDNMPSSSLHPALVEAVALLAGATDPNSKLDNAWFNRLFRWMEDTSNHPCVAQRLRHALTLFSLDAMLDNDRPYNQDGLASLVLYLDSLQSITAEQLQTPVWLDDDHLDLAYDEQMRVPTTDELPCSPWTQEEAHHPSKDLVFHIVHAIIKTINSKVTPGTPYMHCAPLTVALLNNMAWNPCQLIAHFRTMRRCQFQMLNEQAHDLPGEAQTLHGMLAVYVLSYMQSTAWRPAPDQYQDILDTVVWDVLCLTGLGSQAPDWLDVLMHRLPGAGLAALHGLGLAAATKSGQRIPMFSPAFPSLCAYAAAVWEDSRKETSRAFWFERRHPRLAQAMATLLKMLPNGPKAASDWDALNEWWKLDVQGLACDAFDTLDLPMDFSEG